MAVSETREAGTSVPEDLLTLTALCESLGISAATGRNWVKSGRLIPDRTTDSGRPLFSRRTAEKMETDLRSKDGTRLRSRRNKSHVTGRRSCGRYLPSDSPNLPALLRIPENIRDTAEQSAENDALRTRAVLGECAARLLHPAAGVSPCAHSEESRLLALWDGRVTPGPFDGLISDLITDTPAARECILRNAGLFRAPFCPVPGEDTLGALYQSLQDLGERKARGAYYTPVRTADELIRMADISSGGFTGDILDPACGTGIFLLRLPGNISPSQIFGLDTDPVSVALARIQLALRYPGEGVSWLYRQIRCEDFLDREDEDSFAVILGNPPWGAVCDPDGKRRLSQKYSCAGARPESSDLFVEEGIRRLGPGGRLAFVLPESTLYVRAHAPVRRLIRQTCDIAALSCLGEVFSGVQCPCILLLLSRTGRAMNTTGMRVNAPGKCFTVHVPRDLSDDRFSFLMDDEEYLLAEKLKSPAGREYLSGQADFALGIVTGDNRTLVRESPEPGMEPVLLGRDIHRYRLDPPGHWLSFAPEQFQQTAPEKFCRAPEKLIYRFVSGQLTFAYDSSRILTLNSANILIPRIPGLDIRYVLAVLNSRMAQFLYAGEYHSMKVLRSHLEAIPIPRGTAQERDVIVRLSERLTEAEHPEERESLYEEIDKRLALLYNLSEKEYACLRRAVGDVNRFL